MTHYGAILNSVQQKALQCGRNPQEITLIAVSKEHSWEEMQPIYEEGCRHFGESRLQEAETKMFKAPSDIHWHFIGSLQKNKVRKVIDSFCLIHCVDSVELAQKIEACSQEAGVVTRILLEANTSKEPSKHGLSPEEWSKEFEKVSQLSNVTVVGLMTMAPFVEDEGVIRNCFRQLRLLRDELQQKKGGEFIRELSMGMSHDYTIAIQEGATLLRIGTAIFNGM